VQERRVHSQELHDLQFSSDIIARVVDKMGGACGTNRTGGKCIINFTGKSEGLRPPEVQGANVKMVNVYNYYSNKMHTFFIIKNHKILQSVILSCIFVPTCFNPRGSSSGGSMPVPG
jgi:hypothetical protein